MYRVVINEESSVNYEGHILSKATGLLSARKKKRDNWVSKNLSDLSADACVAEKFRLHQKSTGAHIYKVIKTKKKKKVIIYV